jgi:predicted phosphodiesterase
VDTPSRGGRVLTVSDLHGAHPDNRARIEQLRPGSEDDGLIVAGDVRQHAGR